MTRPKQLLQPGCTYSLGPGDEDLQPEREVPPERIDYWVCRRVADFDGGVPKSGVLAHCAHCRAPIAHAPRVFAPLALKVCYQCVGIEPVRMAPVRDGES